MDLYHDDLRLLLLFICDLSNFVFIPLDVMMLAGRHVVLYWVLLLRCCMASSARSDVLNPGLTILSSTCKLRPNGVIF